MGNDIIQAIKNQLKTSIDEQYSEYKMKCLENLNYELEAQRNRVVKDILDGIDVVLLDKQPLSLEPIIQIKVVKHREVHDVAEFKEIFPK